MIPTLFFIVIAAFKFAGSVSTPWTILLILWLLGVLCEMTWVLHD
jgi:hypothetical protein